MSPRRTLRWGPLSHCTRRSLWLLPRQPASQWEHRHCCYGNPENVSKALMDGGESLAAENSMKSQISPRHLLKMDIRMLSGKPKHFNTHLFYDLKMTKYLETKYHNRGSDFQVQTGVFVLSMLCLLLCFRKKRFFTSHNCPKKTKTSACLVWKCNLYCIFATLCHILFPTNMHHYCFKDLDSAIGIYSPINNGLSVQEPDKTE